MGFGRKAALHNVRRDVQVTRRAFRRRTGCGTREAPASMAELLCATVLAVSLEHRLTRAIAIAVIGTAVERESPIMRHS